MVFCINNCWKVCLCCFPIIGGWGFFIPFSIFGFNFSCLSSCISDFLHSVCGLFIQQHPRLLFKLYISSCRGLFLTFQLLPEIIRFKLPYRSLLWSVNLFRINSRRVDLFCWIRGGGGAFNVFSVCFFYFTVLLCNCILIKFLTSILVVVSGKCPGFCKCLRFSKYGFATFSNCAGCQK